ncbi:hypothetical protein KSP40_PGU001363 [Platanthera guangdongensis]|uniref:Uncharacterized protein n=1 Tax=Platanthera guangdongensis TaxID=2320717 RepID=A0ABR2MNI0_9ASPA
MIRGIPALLKETGTDCSIGQRSIRSAGPPSKAEGLQLDDGELASHFPKRWYTRLETQTPRNSLQENSSFPRDSRSVGTRNAIGCAFAIARLLSAFNFATPLVSLPFWSRQVPYITVELSVSRLGGCEVYRVQAIENHAHWMDARALRRKDAFRGKRPWGERASVIHGSPIGKPYPSSVASLRSLDFENLAN